jgi:hypothetical protein
MKYILIIILFISFASYSQTESDGLYLRNYVKSTKEKWDFVVLKNTINAKIIYHAPAPALCGFMTTASITIVKTENNETIRVLDLCNVSDKYKINQIIKITPGVVGSKDYSLPFEFVKNKITGKIEAVPNYDLKVLKTTWGSLID